METLIDLRLQCQKLDPSEHHLFAQQLIEKCGIDFLMTTIFDYYAKFILEKNSYDATNINTIKTITYDIIDERNIYLPQETSLTELPPALVGETASFLKQQDYMNLSFCCRSIYVGCYSPSSLIHFRLPHNTKQFKQSLSSESNIRYNLHPIYWNKYSRIRSLEIYDPKHFNLRNPNIPFSHLTQIAFPNILPKHEQELGKLVANNYINCNNIQHLSLMGNKLASLYGMQLGFNSSRVSFYIKMLSNFPNLRSLTLKHITPNVYQTTIFNSLPELHHLHTLLIEGCDGAFTNALLHAYGKQVHALQIPDDESSNYSMIFPQLKSLDIVGAEKTTMNKILKNTNVLKNVRLTCIESFKIKQQEFEHTVRQCFVEQPHLETIHICIDSHYYDAAFRGIETALNGIELKVKQLKIGVCINAEKAKIESQDELQLKMGKIFKLLSNIEFMFVLRVLPCHLLDVERFINTCKGFNDNLCVSEVEWGNDHDVNDGLKIVINTNCSKFTSAHA